MTRHTILLATMALGLASGPAHGQAPLGTIHFPTSAGPAAQREFETGVLWMHSFEYDSAAVAFRRAQMLEPGFVMAYWGEAMSYTHPVWNEQDLTRARATLERLGPTPAARRARPPTAREQGWLQAVEILYGEGTKPRRDTLYARAMERLAEANPEDDEARAFLSLALLGLNQGVRDVPTYIRAGAIAEEVFRRNPAHPGGAHYMIHAFDDPTHAPLGLRAARAYSTIAPAAAHAQHMTTHIFVALGMWDDLVAQNEVAAGLGDYHSWHYTIWLGYGYAQQGRFGKAKELVDRMRPLGQTARGEGGLRMMRLHYVVNTERWEVALRESPAEGDFVPAQEQFVRGLAAFRLNRPEAGIAALAGLRALRSGRPMPAPGVNATLAVPAILLRALEGAALHARGQPDAAVQALREATALEDAMPYEFGPPEVLKPSHELLGEILLDLGRAAEAQREFEAALALAPGRALSLRGLWRAAEAAGDRETADKARKSLIAIWHQADTDVPELDAVRSARPWPQPPEAPPVWLRLVGEYAAGADTLSVLEERGHLHLLLWGGGRQPLSQIRDSAFQLGRGPDQVVFEGWALPRPGGLLSSGRSHPRLTLGGDGGAGFRITPRRPVADLRREAEGATPPTETGEFLPDDLVELVALDSTIRLDIRYATDNNFMGTPFYSSPRAFLQRPAAAALVRAHRSLWSRGYGVLVHDGYRPWSVTRMFWDATPDALRIFVADPSQGSRHNRGAAVDLTLYDRATGQPVLMPGGYDEMSPRSFPGYAGGTARQRWLRDLLRNAMEREDFTVYEAEWWHFDFRDWRRYRIGNLPFEAVPEPQAVRQP